MPGLLDALPESAKQTEILSDGSTRYRCALIGGSLSLTANGLPEGFTSATKQIDYTFGPDGRLHSIYHHSTGETEILDYIDDAKDPRLAISSSLAKGGWVLHDYEIYSEGRPDLFTPEAVTSRARTMLISYNEQQKARLQTPEAKHQLEQSYERLGGETAPLRTIRLILILVGLTVIGVGSLAWWKNRS